MLVVRDLAHTYHDVGPGHRLNVPAFSCAAGEMVVVAGPSGSGKTTLLNLLAGMLPAQSGSIKWSGTDLVGLGEPQRDRWRLRNCGLVFQNFHLVPELSAEDNVVLPAYFEAWSAKGKRRWAREALAGLGVPSGRRPAATLSRGEQQRTAIVRALLFDPQLIIADEPTASLDAATGAAISAQLAGLAQRGKCVIVASHDAAVRANASRLVEIVGGQLQGDLQ